MTREDWKETILGCSVKILAGAIGLVVWKIMCLASPEMFSFPKLSSIDQMASFVAVWIGGVWILERPIKSFVELFRSEDLARERDIITRQFVSKLIVTEEPREPEEPPDDGKIRVIGYL